MANGVGIAELVQVRLDLGAGKIEKSMEKADRRNGGRGDTAVAHREQLHAVAGGKNHGLTYAGLTDERARRIGQALVRNGQPFAHRNRCRGVVDAHQKKGAFRRIASKGTHRGVHGALNLCTTDNWLAAQTARTKRKAKEER